MDSESHSPTSKRKTSDEMPDVCISKRQGIFCFHLWELPLKSLNIYVFFFFLNIISIYKMRRTILYTVIQFPQLEIMYSMATTPSLSLPSPPPLFDASEST